MVLLALPATAAAALVATGATGTGAHDTVRGPSITSVINSLGRLAVLGSQRRLTRTGTGW